MRWLILFLCFGFPAFADEARISEEKAAAELAPLMADWYECVGSNVRRLARELGTVKAITDTAVAACENEQLAVGWKFIDITLPGAVPGQRVPGLGEFMRLMDGKAADYTAAAVAEIRKR